MLKSIKQMLIWIGLYPDHDSATKQERISHIAFASTMFLAMIFQLSCYLNYFWKNLSIDILGSLFAFFGIAGVGSLIYISITAFCLKCKMKTICENLIRIYDASKLNFRSIHFYFFIKRCNQF